MEVAHRNEKIQCIWCPHYTECSPKTRLYINYCGTANNLFKIQLKNAYDSCKRQKGYAFKNIKLSNGISGHI